MPAGKGFPDKQSLKIDVFNISFLTASFHKFNCILAEGN
jgi:hypothetical protein